MSEEKEKLKEKILHILRIYPVISPTMLQAGLGPQIAAGEWRPILEELIEQKKVTQDSVTSKGPSGRTITYTRILNVAI